MLVADPDDRQSARDWLHDNLTPDMAAARQALADAYADAYVAGAHAAAAAPGLSVLTSLETQESQINWSTWEPGDVRAADIVADGGLATLLDNLDVTMDGISGTMLDQMGTALADGLASGASVDDIADQLADLIGDPDRAFRIADTEVCRATSLASMDTYAENGTAQIDWLVSPEACQICEDLGAGSPYALNAVDPPPAHPTCRCSLAPHLELGDSTDISPEEQAEIDDSEEGA